MNKADGGRRLHPSSKTMDYAESISRRSACIVINGYGSTEGTGGDFTFCELEPAVMTGRA